MILAIYMLVSFYNNFIDAPTAITQIPTRKSITTVPFPSIGVCNGNRLLKSEFEDLAKRL